MGMFTLSGGGFTYTGPTTVSSGTLTLDNVGNNFASSISVASPATLALSASINSEYNLFGSNQSYNLAITGSGAIVKTGTGWTEFCYNAITGFSGQINIQAGILGNGDANSTWVPAPRAWGLCRPGGDVGLAIRRHRLGNLDRLRHRD